MHRLGKQTSLAAAALLALTGAAGAADAFTWRPGGVGLNGAAFTADTLVLGDYARITFGLDGDGSTTFLDRGYMPVLGFTLQGQPVAPAGFNDPSGAGWGAYVDYTATGIQNFGPGGVPISATFTQLDYTLVGYDGSATFGLDAQGNPVVGGTRNGITVLGTGGLISGGLDFVPDPATSGLGISGTASNTIAGVPAAFSGDAFARLDVRFEHPPSEYAFLPALGEIRIPGDGAGSTGTFEIAVPEPGTAALVGAGLLGLGLLRRRMR